MLRDRPENRLTVQDLELIERLGPNVARAHLHGETVAVRALAPSLAELGAERVEAAARDSRSLVADDGTVALVTPWHPGVDLRELVRRSGPLSGDGVLKVARAVADALAALREEARQATLDTSEYEASPYTSPEQLPPTIEIETDYQGFNDYYYFALVDGKLWFKPRFKRPAGAEEWATDLPWRPMGVRHGLPYRLDARKPSTLDTSYTDGDRQAFVRELTFREAAFESWPEHIDAEGWARSGEWPHAEPPVYSEDFTLPERILAITADDDEVAVLTGDRQMFYRRRYANLFVSEQWNEGWGQSKDIPIFFPDHLTGHRGWSLGRITAFGTGYKTGPDGRHYEWGPAAVSMETMVWLSADGHQIYYLDSGTPPEVNHYVEAPFRGQYQGESINSASSTMMLIDRFGAVQTKIADFDLLGSTPTHPYCYNQGCDDQPFYPPGDIRSGMSDIRLPPEDWEIHTPVLPPESWHEHTGITRRIS
ncbi:MAG: hypothetical protein KC621_21410, partial [Myxococcales bacterium]|nr:hypothetical protein [Myxococcales bacterium]